MTKIIFIFLSLSFFLSCSDKDKGKSKSYRYQIEGVSLNNKVKCIVSVRIGNIYERDEMKELSDIIKNQVNCISDHIYISYLQPGMKNEGGSWAVVEYNSGFNIDIIGKTKQNFESLKSYMIDGGKEYLGHWVDLGKQDDLVYRIKKNNTGYSLELCSPSEQNESELCRLRKTKHKEDEIFIDADEPSQYYKINKKGNLDVFDNYGWVVTYQKIK
ncbi:MAG TPA: hypothetical protein PKA77_11425 [Chitinophagaceae bacterium]|nr:hypothetical protein [Chitinophagaceae bacterium]HMU59665.1 hypothetical protein [Chitinophagaceae bacterium]